MYSDEIDRTWNGYTAVVISFSFLILFGPIVPFLYFMTFLTGIVSIHAKKYEIIYFSKRGLPIKVNSIGSWIKILNVVSVIGIFTNVAVVIYIRELFPERKSLVFFSLVFIILILKYAAHIALQPKEDIVAKRARFKTAELIMEKGLSDFKVSQEGINTDIQNLYYDETRLQRKVPLLK